MDLITLALQKNYANLVANGLTNVTVEGNTIIFTLNDGSTHSITIPHPEQENIEQAIEKYLSEHGFDNIDNVIENEVNKHLETITLELQDHDGRIHTLEREIGMIEEENLEWDKIINDISLGYGKEYFLTGDQFMIDYDYNGAKYVCPHNVVDHSDVVILDGEEEKEVHAITLEWEYTTPLGLQFDPREAMYCVPQEGMAAGTYHFTVQGDSWSTGDNGKTFQFTLSSPLTEGMHLYPQKDYNKTFEGTNILIYADGKSFTALYTIPVTQGSTGIDLGTLGSGDLNHYHRIFLGYNNWKESFIRQWLNAEGLGSEWWKPQNKFDRAVSNIATLKGYLDGISDDMKQILKPVKLQTYRNTVTDDGGIDVSYDKVFLLSFGNWNCESNQAIQYPGSVEGNAYEYYIDLAKDIDNLSTRNGFKWATTYPQLIRYALNQKTSAQYIFSRSAYRSVGYNVLYVYTSGFVNYYNAYTGYRVRPACCITGNLVSHASTD